jgi:hypothetical protein
LPPGRLAQSERQILTGLLKKQSQVSIEKALDKRLDFSMQFENTTEGVTQFIGYSIFQTNAKGAYEKSLLAPQKHLKKQLTDLIDPDLLSQTQAVLNGMIQEMYAPYYTGVVGVDMMIYQSGGFLRLHPCVEINMRKNMGYLAIRLTDKYLHPDSCGEYHFEYHPDPQTTNKKNEQLQLEHPLVVENGRIRSGYFSLCPVTEKTNYHAYLLVE